LRRTVFPPALTIGALILAVLAPGAAGARTSHAAAGAAAPDPWEKFNRRVFAFNRRIDRAILVPLARLTTGLTPGPVGRAIHNFLVNLNEPVVMVNDLLQARPGPALRSAFRLLVNSTAGGLGAVDVAKALGDPAHKNGFGDTLGRWGAMPGPYIVTPVLGPGTVRDLFGSIVDDLTLPLQIIDFPYRLEVDITVSIVGGLNERSELGAQYDALLAGAADPYATLRSSYLQAREAQIRGEKALPPLPDIEDATPPPEASPGPPPTQPAEVVSPGDEASASAPPDAAAAAAGRLSSLAPGEPCAAGEDKGQTGASPPPQADGDPEEVISSPETLPGETRL
jgi:phospholipid-binding lipoprotein MlaA